MKDLAVFFIYALILISYFALFAKMILNDIDGIYLILYALTGLLLFPSKISIKDK